MTGPGMPLPPRAEALVRRCPGIAEESCLLALLNWRHPPRGGASSTTFGAAPWGAVPHPRVGSPRLRAHLGTRRLLGSGSPSQRVPRGPDSWRAWSRPLAATSRKGIMCKAYGMGTEGLTGLSFLGYAVGPVVARGAAKVALIKMTTSADPLAERRRGTVVAPRGPSLRAASPAPFLPPAIPTPSPIMVVVAPVSVLGPVGVPPGGMGPLTAPPHFVLSMLSGAITKERPPRFPMSMKLVACIAITGGNSALQRASRARPPLAGALRALVKSSPSCSGWGRPMLGELITGLVSGQSMGDWLTAQFEGAGLRLGRRAPPRRATRLASAVVLVFKFEGLVTGLGRMLPSEPPPFRCLG